MENEYLRAFNFEHNSMVASPYCYTANVTSSSVAWSSNRSAPGSNCNLDGC